MKPTIDSPVRLDLASEDLALVEAGLRLLLMTEDDRDTIERVKALLVSVKRQREVLGR
jgi:hypothetical protein